MSGLDGRLDRLFPMLTARERAILLIQAANGERDPDARVRSTAPASQAVELDRRMARLRSLARYVGPYAFALGAEVEHTLTLCVLLRVLRIWDDERAWQHYVAG